MVERLEYLSLALAAASVSSCRAASAELRDQISEDIETTQRWRAKPWTAPGFTVADLQCDSRVTLYTRWGDWFPQAALVLAGMMILDWLLRRMWRAGRRPGSREAKARVV